MIKIKKLKSIVGGAKHSNVKKKNEVD